MIEKIFVFWILSLPFINSGGVYEGLKIFYFWIGSFLLFLFWIFKGKKDINPLLNRWDYFYWGWILVLSVSSFLGVHPIDSLIGGSYRHQGVIFFISLWIVGKTIKILSKKNKQLLKRGLGIAILMESILVFFQILLNKNLVFGKPIGTFGESNAVAGFLASGSFFVSDIYLLIISFVAIILTKSRSGVISFFIIILAFFRSKKIRISLILLMFLSLFFVWKSKVLDKISLYSFENRQTIYFISINSFFKKPFLGYGVESGEVVFEDEFQDKDINLGNFMIDRTHNLFLDILMWSGVLGLFFFGSFIFGNLYDIYKYKKYKQLCGFLGVLFFSFLQPLGVIHWILFFVVLNW